MIELDHQLFQWINSRYDPILDFIMYWASDKFIWIPFYAWLLWLMFLEYGKKVWMVMIAATLMIVLTDQASVWIKETVQRLRPCHDPMFAGIIHLVENKCGGKFGFVSSHAANSMGLAVLIWKLLPPFTPVIKAELIAYVAIIAYSRIYLGAHFPGDVIGGWLTGLFAGLLIALILKTVLLRNRIQQKAD